MSVPYKNKVDMSLDDIIKISRAEKRQSLKTTKRLGRGRGVNRGRGIARGGQERGVGRGRGRGGAVRGGGRGIRGVVRGGTRGMVRGGTRGMVRGGIRGVVRGGTRGVVRGGRGRARGIATLQTTRGAAQVNQRRGMRSRGRGGVAGINRQNTGVSPTNRLGSAQVGQGRGRGRGRGNGIRGVGQQMVFTNRRNRWGSQQERSGGAWQESALLQERQQALRNLEQAKRNMQSVNQAIQKSSREAIVNQNRGLTNLTAQSKTQDRRKLLNALRQQTGNRGRGSPLAARQMMHTSVTISNPTAPRGGRRRGWRRGPNQRVAANQQRQQHLMIQVPNQSLIPVKKESSAIIDQLKMLKPAVSTTYKFQKNAFATPATGVSLNDRFALTSSSTTSFKVGAEDRKIFI